jgi:hypothetical protein
MQQNYSILQAKRLDGGKKQEQGVTRYSLMTLHMSGKNATLTSIVL